MGTNRDCKGLKPLSALHLVSPSSVAAIWHLCSQPTDLRWPSPSELQPRHPRSIEARVNQRSSQSVASQWLPASR